MKGDSIVLSRFFENHEHNGKSNKSNKKIRLRDLVKEYHPDQDHPIYEVADGPRGNEVW